MKVVLILILKLINKPRKNYDKYQKGKPSKKQKSEKVKTFSLS